MLNLQELIGSVFGVHIYTVGKSSKLTDLSRNTATVVIIHLIKSKSREQGIEISMIK